MDTTERLRIRLEQLIEQPSPDGPEMSVALTRGPNVPELEGARTAIVREMRGQEQKILVSEGMAPVLRLGTLVAACTKAIGSVQEPEKIRLWVRGMTTTDRMLLFLAARRATLSPQLPYIVTCPNLNCVDESGKRTEHLQEVNLGDFEVIPPTCEAWSREETLPSGRKALIVPLTGREEELIAKFDGLSKGGLGALARLRKLDGRDIFLREGINFKDIAPLVKLVDDLPGGDLDAIRAYAFEMEGGVDTSATMECPECGHTWTAEVHIGEGFFAPLAVRTRWKKKSSG